jgi:hypothetical protein
MTDLTNTIVPKSDQLNADDLIAGPKTILITKVSACPGSAEQPIAIYFEGDNNKPYKPCKSMRRVLVQVWGVDGASYVGRAMTLFRDPGVQFGGVAVGGIRISHMSHIDTAVTLALTATRASRKPYTVKPLQPPTDKPPATASLDERIEAVKAALRGSNTIADRDLAWKRSKKLRDEVDPETLQEIELIYEARGMELEAAKKEAV